MPEPEPPASRDPGREPLRVGVAGGGFVAHAVHLPLPRELPGQFALTAIAERSRRVREALAARHAIPGA